MNRNESIRALVGLAHLDMDAYFAYNHALAHIDKHAIREQFRRMRNEHLEHTLALRTAIHIAGVQPPALTRDFRGLLLEGVTILRAITGTPGALQAMCSIEEIVCRSYTETLALGLPDDFQMLCERLFANLALHRAYLRGATGKARRHAPPHPEAQAEQQ
jgi:hypothetical protein